MRAYRAHTRASYVNTSRDVVRSRTHHHHRYLVSHVHTHTYILSLSLSRTTDIDGRPLEIDGRFITTNDV